MSGTSGRSQVRRPLFWLGIHHPNWAWGGQVDCPVFISHTRLRERKSRFPAARVPAVAIDSGGFTELQRRGGWTVTPAEYVVAVSRYDAEIGRLDWAAPQDRMCEKAIIYGGVFGGQRFAGTRQFIDPRGVMSFGQIVGEHQRLTVENFHILTALWPQFSDRRDCPFRPVLQGEPGQAASYRRHAEMYEDAGIHLADYPLVGVGSVCRLQSSPMIGRLACGLAPLGLPLHWFGLKLDGLPRVWPHIFSHDSQAWGTEARHSPRLEGCTHVRVRGKYTGQASTCANCPRAARRYAGRVAALARSLPDPRGHVCQGELFDDYGQFGDAA